MKGNDFTSKLLQRLEQVATGVADSRHLNSVERDTAAEDEQLEAIINKHLWICKTNIYS